MTDSCIDWGGELKGKAISSVGIGLCYTQITAWRGNKNTLTLLSTSAYSLAYDEW